MSEPIDPSKLTHQQFRKLVNSVPALKAQYRARFRQTMAKFGYVVESEEQLDECIKLADDLAEHADIPLRVPKPKEKS